MSQKRSRTTPIFVVTETSYTDDYKTHGDDWSSSEVTAFSSQQAAEKYARKCYRRELRGCTRGSDYKANDTSEFAERARSRDAFLAKKYDGDLFSWAWMARDLLQGEFVVCKFTAMISEQQVHDDCSDSEEEVSSSTRKRR